MEPGASSRESESLLLLHSTRSQPHRDSDTTSEVPLPTATVTFLLPTASLDFTALFGIRCRLSNRRRAPSHTRQSTNSLPLRSCRSALAAAAAAEEAPEAATGASPSAHPIHPPTPPAGVGDAAPAAALAAAAGECGGDRLRAGPRPRRGRQSRACLGRERTDLRRAKTRNAAGARVGRAEAGGRVPALDGAEAVLLHAARVLALRDVLEALRVLVDERVEEAEGRLAVVDAPAVEQRKDASHHRARCRGARDAGEAAARDDAVRFTCARYGETSGDMGSGATRAVPGRRAPTRPGTRGRSSSTCPWEGGPAGSSTPRPPRPGRPGWQSRRRSLRRPPPTPSRRRRRTW